MKLLPQHFAFIGFLLIGMHAGYQRYVERIDWENEFNEQVLAEQRAMFEYRSRLQEWMHAKR